MDLTERATILQKQAEANSTIVLDSTVFPSSVLDDIRNAFALASGTNLTVTNVKPQDIQAPTASGVLAISAGTVTVLNQSDVKTSLTFTASGETLDAIIAAT